MSWYKDWFNSPYYHVLYQNRDEEEAEKFISHLVERLNLKADATLMDLACGKGRHSKYLASLGFRVFGLDLASESIRLAQKDKADNVSFFVHDMREVFKEDYFDAIFSFFTSFGYFDDKLEDERVFKSVEKQLKNKGLYVLDFMNSHKVKQNLVAQETKTLDGIEFKIQRKVAQGKIQKTVSFRVDDEDFSFTEKVSDLNLAYFESLAKIANLELVAVYGSYDLTEFDRDSSNRLIMHFKKS